MMAEVVLLGAILVLGALVGTATGLLPGLHVNTVAPMVLGLAALAPDVPGLLTGGAIAALLILVIALVHTIINVIPTLAAPIPDADETLVLLPVQRLAQAGHAVDALRISVRASWLGGSMAAVVALVVLFVFPGGAPVIPPRLALWGITAVVMLIVLGHPRSGHAFALFLLAGCAGFLLLDRSFVGPLGGDGTVLLPAFAGLFGTPLLLLAVWDAPVAGTGTAEGPAPVASRVAAWVGTFCGLLVALVPGLTSATAGAVGRSIRRPPGDADDVAMLSAIDTANVVGNTAALLVWDATRSGAGVAARDALPAVGGAAAGALAALTVGMLLLAGWAAAAGALRWGPGIVVALRRVPARRLAVAGLVLLGTIVVLHGGLWALIVVLCLTPLGFLPHRWGVPRALLMGFLLVPYLLAAGSA